MESTQEVEVELEELTTAKEETKESQETKEDKGNIYSALTQPSDHVYGVPSTQSYTVNEDIHQKVRRYRTTALVLLAICVLLLILVLVQFAKLIGKQSCQTDPSDPALVQECNLEKCQDVYQESLFHEKSECSCITCDVDWLRFENSCYFLSKGRLSWHESRKECQRKGGDLAIITDKRLQSYLSKNGNMHYWIGLNQVGTNQWIWNNNTVLTVRYWGNMFSNGDCALMAANEPPEQSWHQSICTLYLQYICQITIF